MTHEKIPVTQASPSAELGNDLYKSREKIYSRLMFGRFQTIRHVTMWAFLVAYFFAPWLNWAGRQAVLFDISERKFYIFGLTFFPQDFLLLSWLLIMAAFALFLITVMAGRVWCGYTCPQTVWTTLFMLVEHVTEGDRNKRMKLDAQPMSAEKIMRKSAKHSLWFLIAFATGFAFVGYFTPVRSLYSDIVGLDLDAWGWFWLVFFTLMTYMNAGWLREQVCLYMCPYARFQSVMFDRDTLIVTYDAARGEPRGSRKKTADPKAEGLGDCVGCNMCVQVCPTGIDIRDGLQYECIGCAACIDVCDNVMDQMGYARGLVSYSTENKLEGKPGKLIRGRLIGYALMLSIMAFAFCYVLITRVPVELDVLRDRGQLYRETWDGGIQNAYTVKIQNKTQEAHTYRITVEGLQNPVVEGPVTISAAAGQLVETSLSITARKDSLTSRSQTFQITVQAQEDESIKRSSDTRFLSP